MNKSLKILIIEDEKCSSDYIVALLGKVAPQAIVIAQLSSNAEVFDYFTRDNVMPDLVLSDIRLCDGEVFSGINSIPHNIAIVFITAYDSYALKVFEYNSIGYILKPASEESLTKVLDKYTLLTKTSTAVDILQAGTEENSYLNKLVIYRSNQDIPVKVKDIALCLNNCRSSKIYLKDGRWGISEKNLTWLEQSLNPEKFIRISRQIIVAKDSVRNFSHSGLGNKVTLNLKTPCNEPLEISHYQYMNIKDKL